MIAYAQPVAPERYTIKDRPVTERPRERLESLGAKALSLCELLALLIETGTPAAGDRPARTALELAEDVLKTFAPPSGEQSLRRIIAAPLSRLCTVPGIGPAKAVKIKAALELGCRAAFEVRLGRDRVTSPRDVYELLRLSMRDLPHEEFHVLLLNTQHEIIRELVISTGTLDGALVHPREVFRPALAESAASVVLVHNHPSGEPTPSDADVELTRQLVAAGLAVGIEVLDHIVIGEGRYVSMVERKYMRRPGEQAEAAGPGAAGAAPGAGKGGERPFAAPSTARRFSTSRR